MGKTRNGGGLRERKLAEGTCAPTLTSMRFIALNYLPCVPPASVACDADTRTGGGGTGDRLQFLDYWKLSQY